MAHIILFMFNFEATKETNHFKRINFGWDFSARNMYTVRKGGACMLRDGNNNEIKNYYVFNGKFEQFAPSLKAHRCRYNLIPPRAQYRRITCWYSYSLQVGRPYSTGVYVFYAVTSSLLLVMILNKQTNVRTPFESESLTKE